MSEKELLLEIINILKREYHSYNKAHEISLLLNYDNGYIYILQDIETMYNNGFTDEKIAQNLMDKFYMLPNPKI